jgi:hypothetical protein
MRILGVPISFIAGLGTGCYAAQNYKLPDMRMLLRLATVTATQFEREHRVENSAEPKA